MAASRNRCPLLAATGAKSMGWDTLTGTMGTMGRMGIMVNQDVITPEEREIVMKN